MLVLETSCPSVLRHYGNSLYITKQIVTWAYEPRLITVFETMQHRELRSGWTEFSCLLGYYAAWSGFKPTFRDYLSVPSSRVKVSSWTAWPLKMGPIGSRETSVLNQITPRNSPEDGSIQFNRGGSLRSRTEQTPLTTKIRKSNPNHCYVSSNDANCQISKSRYRLIKITENQIMTFNAPT